VFNSTAIDLDDLITTFGQAANFWETLENAEPLVRARLADAGRNAGIRPVSGDAFDAVWKEFDQERERRFCILVTGLDFAGVAKRLPSHCIDKQMDPVLELLKQLTVRLELLTLDVLLQSDVRVEEFTRHFCAAWGLRVKGESIPQSAKRLDEIDFGRLMKEAESARLSAHERLAYLRELQEKEEETRRPKRGKW
jgi:hypothetical protein